LNMPLDQLRAVTQHSQCRDGAEAAGLKIYRRPVVDLSVNHGIHKVHDLRREFGHGSRLAGAVARTIIASPEIGRSLPEALGVLVGGQSFPRVSC